jgi:diguanylate cyclase (GGDEF)-like protein/PAS domain S-box-containing protein
MQLTNKARHISRPINATSAHFALRNRQFVPYFQPIVHIRTGQLEGFEILARWQHPDLGLIQPAEFIPSAEKYGWINALTQELLRSAFAMASLLPEALTLSINISSVQLRNSGLPSLLSEAASAADFALSRLIVEITESALIQNIDEAREVAQALKRIGCNIALDDFGTGYSSLLHLQSLPFDEIKVDRSFVKSMIDRRECRKIVAAVVGLGQSLGLRTIAEGIENEEQAEMLLWLGCERGQGFLYGHPLPVHEVCNSLTAIRHKPIVGTRSPWKNISVANLDIAPLQRIAQLQAIYDGAPVGLAFIDQSLRYVNLNQKLADMNGAAVEDHLGSKVSDMIPDLFPMVEPHMRRALRGERVCDFEANLPNSQGARLVSYQPARDEVGEIVGVSVAVIDISQRKRIEEALQKTEGLYRSMVDLDPELLWVMDSEGRDLDLSPRRDTTTGLIKTETAAQGWMAAIHPNDWPRTLAAITASRMNAAPIDVEYRAADDAGNFKWKRSRGLPRFDAAGRVVCWYGSIQDTDQTNECPKRLHEKHPNFPVRSLLSASSVSQVNKSSCLLADRHLRGEVPTLISPPLSAGGCAGTSNSEMRVQALARLDILDTPAEAEFNDLVELASEVCSTPISIVTLLDSERQWFKASVGMAARETQISISFCAHAIQQHGLFMVEDATQDARFQKNPLVLNEPNIRFYAGMPLYAEKGIAIGTLCVIDTVPRSLSPGQAKALSILSQQVQARIELRSERINLLQGVASNRELAAKLEVKNNELLEANSQLEHLATTDGLTGLLNRREFEQRMDTEFSRALRKRRALSMIVMDVDDFKQRNDELGHAAGDEALRHVGQVLGKLIRVTDSAARIGGEECAVILPETTANQAAVFGRRIQAALGAGGAGFPRITLSLGVASVDTHWTTWESLFKRADSAMYEAKRAGKNQIAIAEPAIPYLKQSEPSFAGVNCREESALHHRTA